MGLRSLGSETLHKLSRLGVDLDRHGRGACPVHGGDGESSFSARETDDGGLVWHCFACGAGGGWKKLLKALGFDEPADGSVTTRRKRKGPKDYDVHREIRRQYRELLDEWRAAWELREGDDLLARYIARDAIIAKAEDWFDEPTFGNRIEFLDAVADGSVVITSDSEYDLNLCRSDSIWYGRPTYDPLVPLSLLPCKAARLLKKRLKQHAAMMGEEPDGMAILRYAAFSDMEASKSEHDAQVCEWIQRRAALAARSLRQRDPDTSRVPVGRDRRYPRCVLAWVEAASRGDGDGTRKDRNGDVSPVATRREEDIVPGAQDRTA